MAGMKRSARVLAAAAGAAAFSIGLGAAGTAARAADTPAAAGADRPMTNQEMSDRIKALEAELRQVKAGQVAAEQADEARNAAATADALLRDADRHSALLDMEGFTAGYTSDRGFVLRSADGNFLFHPWVQFAFRNVTNYREDAKQGGTADDTQNGFEIRRAKIGFDGNLWGPDFKYTFIWNTDRKSQALGLEEAWFIYKMGNFGIFPEPISVEAGQFKNYFAHESMSSSKKIFAVERTLLNDVFTGGDNFIQGAAPLYNEGNNGGPLQAAMVINDGSNDFSAAPSSTPRNFQDFPTNKWDFGAAGRVQYKFFGKWKDYEDFTAATASGDPLLVAAARSITARPAILTRSSKPWTCSTRPGRWRSTVRSSAGRCGTAAWAARAPARPTRPPRVRGTFTTTASSARPGTALNKQWELFGQYSYIQFDGGEFAAGTETTVHEITVGVNYYMHGHNAKLTIDGTWLPNGTPVANDGGGILAEPNGKNELLLRAQFQLLL